MLSFCIITLKYSPTLFCVFLFLRAINCNGLPEGDVKLSIGRSISVLINTVHSRFGAGALTLYCLEIYSQISQHTSWFHYEIRKFLNKFESWLKKKAKYVITFLGSAFFKQRGKTTTVILLQVFNSYCYSSR